MKSTYITLVLILMMGLVACKPTEAPEPVVAAEEVKKVVYHIDFYDTDRVSAILTSINNMVNTYQESLKDYDVRIVFLGAGIRFTQWSGLRLYRWRNNSDQIPYLDLKKAAPR